MAALSGITLYLLIGAVSCSLVVDYYQKLLNQKTKEALSFKLPKINGEFKEGIQSTPIIEYGEFDFVIVGAGTAGCVLATRLSEVEKISILLIEAGGEEGTFNQIPAMWLYHQFSKINWGYYTTPQKHCCQGMNNTQCIIPRGKVVGGSSSINAIMFVRGNCKDYDNWAALGNRGWSCKEVLPYFKKFENSQILGDTGYHGKGDLWNVEYSIPSSPLFNNFVNGSLESKQAIVDYNGRKQIGASKLQFSIKRGKRQSLGTAFLDNGRKRSNLKVITKALVTKIIIDRQSKVATGVEFVTRNKKFHVRAKKEVIVSAGAINTPQLLMLSGIGPKDHLRDMKIPLISNLPVGKNLIEHPLFNLVVRTNYTLPDVSMDKIVELYLNGLGPLTKGAGIEGIGFTSTDNSSVPDIEILFAAPYGIDTSIYRRGLNFNNEISEGFLKQINPKSDMLMYIVLLHEKSRGQILLKTNSPIDFPNIDLNMFQEQEDVDTLIQGVEYVINLLKTKAFQKLNATLLEAPICTDVKTNFKKFWSCLIRHMAATIFHVCGTAAMGPNRKKFVVNDNLQVYGVKKLRVVDASIFPLPVSGHTNAPTVMVAEKAADIIKAKFEQ